LLGKGYGILLFDPATQVSEKLIDTELLYSRDLGCDKGMDLMREFMVEKVVGGYHDHLGTELEGLGDRHSGLDPEGSGFIAGGGDDTAYLLPPINDINELLFEVLLIVTIKQGCHKGSSVVIHEPDMGTLAAKYLQIASPPYSDRLSLE
jgi:hypothetical protein